MFIYHTRGRQIVGAVMAHNLQGFSSRWERKATEIAGNPQDRSAQRWCSSLRVVTKPAVGVHLDVAEDLLMSLDDHTKHFRQLFRGNVVHDQAVLQVHRFGSVGTDHLGIDAEVHEHLIRIAGNPEEVDVNALQVGVNDGHLDLLLLASRRVGLGGRIDGLRFFGHVRTPFRNEDQPSQLLYHFSATLPGKAGKHQQNTLPATVILRQLGHAGRTDPSLSATGGSNANDLDPRLGPGEERLDAAPTGPELAVHQVHAKRSEK